MDELTVDVMLNAPTLFDMTKQLGDQSGKAYLIVKCDNQQYPIVYASEKYQELTQFQFEEIHRRSFRTIFVQNQQQIIATLEESVQARQLFRQDIFQVKKQGTFCSTIECFPFQQYYLILIEDITKSQLVSYIERLEQKMFLAIEQNKSFYERISSVCSEVDRMFASYSYTAVTLNIKNELVMMLSDQFEVYPKKQFVVEDKQELALFRQVMREKKVLQIEDFEAYAINGALKDYLLGRNYRSCWIVPIVKDDEAVGVMLMFYQTQRRVTAVYEHFGKRLMEIFVASYELHQQQLLIQELAYIDQATNLPNLHHFKKTLQQLKEQGEQGVIKIVKADEFSKIVELYGQGVGDTLLKQLGERIQQASTSDIFHLARFSSSSLIIFSRRDFKTARKNALFLYDLSAKPFYINDTETYITLKSGIAAFGEEVSYEGAIRFAEVALERAKKTAGTKTEFYEEHMEVARQREMQILTNLSEAIRQREIITHFQPKVMLYRERVASVEALARWHSKKLGFVSPAEFIPIAESTGLIREIDLLMLEQIVEWMQRRMYEGKRIIPVAVNISPTHFYHPDFVMDVKCLLSKYYIDPNYLIVEVTESIGLADLKRAQMILRDLHLLGIKTSVDDFGIGYSSLSYLQKFSFQELKIDRSFTWKLHECGTLAIVRAIIQLAHTLAMTVTAEGVETFEQAQLLKKLGCDLAQGYYYYKPMTIADFEQMFDQK